ncbi:unnamed protein product, partial [Ectocarpus sp. 13 AM-2016]
TLKSRRVNGVAWYDEGGRGLILLFSRRKVKASTTDVNVELEQNRTTKPTPLDPMLASLLCDDPGRCFTRTHAYQKVQNILKKKRVCLRVQFYVRITFLGKSACDHGNRRLQV